MKQLAGISFGLALSMAAISPVSVSAAPVGAMAEMEKAGVPSLVEVQARPRARGGVPGGRSRGVVRRGGRGGAVAAGALIGAAIVGGAIIANSQRRYEYYDDGYYAPAPVYGGGYPVAAPPPADSDVYAPGYYAPAPGYYYGAPGYYPRRPVHRYRHMRDPAGGGTLK